MEFYISSYVIFANKIPSKGSKLPMNLKPVCLQLQRQKIIFQNFLLFACLMHLVTVSFPACGQVILKPAPAMQPEREATGNENEAADLTKQADWLSEQGKYVEAEPLFKRALAIREKIFGLQHPKTAESLSYLAEMYIEQGKLDLAKPLEQRVQQIKKRTASKLLTDTKSPLRQLDSSYFPIHVYINPVMVSTEGSDAQPVPPEFLENLRQGVLDWNRLMISLPEKATADRYTVLLNRAEDGTPETLAKLDLLGFLTLVNDPAKADLVIETENKKVLLTRTTEKALAYFRNDQKYRVGRIVMGVEYRNNALKLRAVVIHEMAHALGLGHIESLCNVMSEKQYTCQVNLPACKDNNSACIGINDEQLRQVESQWKAPPPKVASIEPPPSKSVKSRITTIQDWLAIARENIHKNWKVPSTELTRTGGKAQTVLLITVARSGHIESVSIQESCGVPNLDDLARTAVKAADPLPPFPKSFKAPKLILDFSFEVNRPI
ncbi:MAG: TonB family protein [Anaerolineae bacterium]|nr:TonB family protein [Gloeobacterales cyanobacterium ES-bin-313]